MSPFRSIRTRLTSIFAGWNFKSLSTGIVIAMCAGLLLPALTGGLVLTGLSQKRMDENLDFVGKFNHFRISDPVHILPVRPCFYPVGDKG